MGENNDELLKYKANKYFWTDEILSTQELRERERRKNLHLPVQFEYQHDEEDQGEDPGQQNPLSQRHLTDRRPTEQSRRQTN